MKLGDPRSVVAAKRDGKTLASDDVEAFIGGFVEGEISDALASAFLMACLLQGLDEQETLALTRAMVASGDTLQFAGRRDRPTVDKHSTGGVADGVTLAFAPIAAAMGLRVVKLSGRGLAHTGGTLDKLESIPGLRTDLSRDQIERQVAGGGCAVAAQSARLVPADAKLYALRDATATVPSIPLIAASVMSKKLAVQTDVILLDVKVGSGAFMRTSTEAEDLARACLALARGWGRAAHAAVTDMSQPLGDAIGNALDIAEAVNLLRGEIGGRLRELSIVFAARALSATEGVPRGEARARAERAVGSGQALERFRGMVQAQGGDPRVADDPWSVMERAPVALPILANQGGRLAAVNAAEIGMASGDLGAGRVRKGDSIDHAVGIVFTPKIGDVIEVGEPLGEIHARSIGAADAALARVLDSLTMSQDEVAPPPLVHGWFETDGRG